MNERMEQINSLLQQKLAEVFSQRLEIPFEFFITISRIDCSKDLKHAKVYLSVLPFNKSKTAITWIIRNKGEVQKAFSKIVKNLKYTPNLKFFIDETEEKTNEIYDIIDNL